MTDISSVLDLYCSFSFSNIFYSFSCFLTYLFLLGLSLSSSRSFRPRRHDIGDPLRAFSVLQDGSDPTALGPMADSQVALPSSTLGQELQDSVEKVRVIWGTNIVIKETVTSFRDFLINFTMGHKRLAGLDDAESTLPPPTPQNATPLYDVEPFYPRLLRQLKETEVSFLNLDGSNLKAYQPTQTLYHQLICHPQEIIPLMDMTVNELFAELFPELDAATTEPIQVRPFNMGCIVNMRELSPGGKCRALTFLSHHDAYILTHSHPLSLCALFVDVDQLITIKGLVIRSSSILPDMRTAFFKCANCDYCMTVENVKGKVQEPLKCPRNECHANHSMVLIHNRCIYSDKQLVKVQETPGKHLLCQHAQAQSHSMPLPLLDSVPDGQTPHSVTVCVYDSLVDVTRPGDR